jgi:hypothetical protein
MTQKYVLFSKFIHLWSVPLQGNINPIGIHIMDRILPLLTNTTVINVLSQNSLSIENIILVQQVVIEDEL